MAKANYCICCDVVSCSHHCAQENYCSLDRIEVGTHEPHPGREECTDCKCFEKK